jgi:hypothetical protein
MVQLQKTVGSVGFFSISTKLSNLVRSPGESGDCGIPSYDIVHPRSECTLSFADWSAAVSLLKRHKKREKQKRPVAHVINFLRQ